MSEVKAAVDQSTDQKRNFRWDVPAAVLLVLGLMAAVVWGHGFEIQPQARATALVVASGVFALPLLFRQEARLPWPVLVSGILVLTYFGLRAARSPSWDLARLDLNLLAAGWLSFLIVTAAVRRRAFMVVLFTGLALLVVINGVFAIGQAVAGEGFVLWGNPERPDKRSVGLFGHANPMGGFLAIVLPLLAGVAVSASSWVLRILLGLTLLPGFAALVLSQSRGAAVAAIFAFLVLTVGLVLTSSAKWSKGRRWASRLFLVFLFVAALPFSFVLVSELSERRGHGNDAEQALSRNGRLDFMGMAVEQWSERPWVGGGSRSFSYEAIKRWDREDIGSWVGNAVMVHCDYLQLLAEYGVIGFCLLAVFLGYLVLRVPFRGLFADTRTKNSPLELGALAAVAAAALHGAVDFTMHVLPVLMVVAVCLALLVPGVHVGKRSAGGVLLVLGSALVAMAMLFSTSLRDWRSMKTFFALERDLHEVPFGDAQVAYSGELLSDAPQFELARLHGFHHLEKFRQSGFNDVEALGEALNALEIAVARHPLDPESLGNLALALNFAGQDERADAIYQRAVTACWRREWNFGILRAYSDFLTKRGEQRWQERKPEEALALFLRAYEYHQASLRLHFRGETRVGRLTRERWLRERIEFLEGAGISPAALEGIPAPPED